MTRIPNSYRRILHASSIIGGASCINILVGLVRTKVAAVLLGPAGVGIIGLLQNLMATGSAVSALGLGTAGTRQIAEAFGKGDEAGVAAARRALFWGTMALAFAGGGGFWFLGDVLATQILHDGAANTQTGWLAVGVALSVAAGSQSAVLNGLHRVRDLAQLSIASSLLSTILGVSALLWQEKAGLLLFVIAAPTSNFILGHWFVRRVGHIRAPATTIAELSRQWRAMVRLGVPFMVSGLIVTIGQLLVRTLVQCDLGAAALGQFQAAWLISMTYIGFVLSAMGTDYYPRLTAAIHDHELANRLVNEQTEVSLLLAGPILLAMLSMAPWVIELLYSTDFGEAVAILRWQIMGDLLKVMSWPLGFIILAAGDGRTFMLTELVAISVFIVATWTGLPALGAQATGVGFLAMYLVLLPSVYWIARCRIGFRFSVQVKKAFLLALGEEVLVFVVGNTDRQMGLVLGIFLCLISIWYAYSQIVQQIPKKQERAITRTEA